MFDLLSMYLLAALLRNIKQDIKHVMAGDIILLLPHLHPFIDYGVQHIEKLVYVIGGVSSYALWIEHPQEGEVIHQVRSSCCFRESSHNVLVLTVTYRGNKILRHKSVGQKVSKGHECCSPNIHHFALKASLADITQQFLQFPASKILACVKGFDGKQVSVANFSQFLPKGRDREKDHAVKVVIVRCCYVGVWSVGEEGVMGLENLFGCDC